MKKIFSIVLAAVLFAVISGPLFAATAKVTYVKGKVEVNRNNEWVALKMGDEIKESETISTGFQSEARLNLNGSVMAVPALSRVTLETLKTSGTKDNVSIYIDTGAVRSKVVHTEGKKIEYTARTSVAVASVRGTDFALFSSGKAKCYSGAIAVWAASKDKKKDAAADEIEEVEETEEDDGTADTSSTTAADSAVTEPTETPVAPAAKNEGPATATTAAEAISSAAPVGAIVVGAGQTSKIEKQTGIPTKPLTEAKQQAEKAKATVSSAAEKESISAGGAVSVIPETPVIKPSTTGSISVTIKFEE